MTITLRRSTLAAREFTQLSEFSENELGNTNRGRNR
jgi:hypothetical protein